MEIVWWMFPVLFAAGLMAGLVDAVAGGGGVITLPVLLNLGLPVPVAFGTNKLQAVFGSGTATWHYGKAGLVRADEVGWGIVATAVGAWGGAWALGQVDNAWLERAIPWVLLLILLYSLFKPDLGAREGPARVPFVPFALGAGLVLGAYDGFFGPGTGSFWTLAVVLSLGWSFPRATGYTKVMNFTSNAVALLFFLGQGTYHLPFGLTMAAGQMVGARLGAGLVVQRGARLVRPLFVTMVAATLGRLIWKTYFSG